LFHFDLLKDVLKLKPNKEKSGGDRLISAKKSKQINKKS